MGDKTYASAQSKKLAALHGIDFLCLHSWKLAFVPPSSGKKVSVVCPLSEKFHALLTKEGMEEKRFAVRG